MRRLKTSSDSMSTPDTLTFTLSPEQVRRLSAWTEEQDRLVWQWQRDELEEKPDEADTFKHALNAAGEPYYGAVEGHLTYCFSPNSIGEILVVKHAGTKAELDLTDYGSW